MGALQVQNVAPNKNIDGAYTALFEERGASGPTKNKVIQLGENNGTQLLAIAACEQCFPAVYSYKKNLSEQFGKAVFYNASGLYVLSYDNDSFVIVMPSLKAGEDFSYHNFYSKRASKAESMTKDSIEKYATKLLDLL